MHNSNDPDATSATHETSHTPDGDGQTLIEPEKALPEVALADLPEPLRQAVARAGWDGLMPVQAKSLPYLLKGLDLMVQSRTGSGKTGAFLLPIFHRMDLERDQTQALILTPTRELAKQVAGEAEMLFKDTGLRVSLVYGGVGYGTQTDALRAGAHLVVGTPGRILDHLLRHNFTLQNLKTLVFDEADRMLSIGFYPDMREIKRYLPKRRVSTFLFSATYPPHVLRLAEEFMEEPNFLSLSAKQVHVADIEHVYHEVSGMDKDRTLVRLLERDNPASAIIFSNTKANVHYITEVLKGFGYDAEELSADLTQAKREQVLARLRSGTLRFLVATDVAARGIDIQDLSHVIQYEPPEDPESYIHRAGRTGRAGASGTAVTLVNIMEEIALKRIGARFGIDLQKRPGPTDEEVASVVAERTTALLEAELRNTPPLKQERLKRFLPLIKDMAASDEDLLALALLLDERYQAALHAPQVAFEPQPERRRDQTRSPRPKRDPRPPRSDRPRSEHTEDDQRERGALSDDHGPADGHALAGDAEGQKKRKRRRPRRKKPAEASGPTDDSPRDQPGAQPEAE